MRLCLLLFVAGVLLSGCQTGTDAITTSAARSTVTGPVASAIAGDIAGRYAEQAGSTATPIRLHSDASDFATALEAALKGWGFTVVTDDKARSLKDTGKPIELAYSLIDVDGQVLARLSSETLELGRAYSVSSGGATPASPLSLMKRN
ncbi:conjugal transfer protein TrbH [Agrobacterium tumefaciens]|uniref:conjugal transfer protein TrbH n=1 Tax=Agrobacterium tumefaciens TaxID=358 RepID=UPI001574D123|nr:conjugal transfer protein TrbH [Agrobacterium tumefaciens]NSZ03224.1 conjugal transfer protein TrbH [Agrobacterium tumefaciens]NSZ36633.1 conjugal transfer protein TrbH [Agrobacterium tumefaciens]NTA84739.1 conjugal transfer protein TrbH [Agrobacterium tumefaciens]NTB24759.1 conjugal transfer protein TrbH [Agrobacterium tumefaciens]NTB27495.1 conjugal transfer protein TrbH [Agrobacterium tumefaciens]